MGEVKVNMQWWEFGKKPDAALGGEGYYSSRVVSVCRCGGCVRTQIVLGLRTWVGVGVLVLFCSHGIRYLFRSFRC